MDAYAWKSGGRRLQRIVTRPPSACYVHRAKADPRRSGDHSWRWATPKKRPQRGGSRETHRESVAVKYVNKLSTVSWAYPITWTLSSMIFLVYFLKADWIHNFDKHPQKA